MNRSRLYAILGLIVALVLAFAWQLKRPKPVMLIPKLTGEGEYCLTCHAELTEISPSHPVESFGCVLCHGGQPLALEADLAHSTMRGGDNPSRLDVVEESCGGEDCHSGPAEDLRDHIQRVESSVQATYAGAIANIRYSFGAQDDLKAQQAISAVQDPDGVSQTGVLALETFEPDQDQNPSIKAFADNCLFCHLAAEPLAGEKFQRFTGCAACHTPGAEVNSKEQEIHQLTISIPYTQCNTCHNRGNYDLRSMQFIHRSDQPTDRLNDYYQPIAQFVRCEWTLDCIDCHTRFEAMGDGDLHNNQAEIQYIQCKTCHGTLSEYPKIELVDKLGSLLISMPILNPVIGLEKGDQVLVTERGEPLWNTRMIREGVYELYGKASGEYFTFRAVMGTGCEQNPEQQESRYCHVCHAIER